MYIIYTYVYYLHMCILYTHVCIIYACVYIYLHMDKICTDTYANANATTYICKHIHMPTYTYTSLPDVCVYVPVHLYLNAKYRNKQIVVHTHKL